jgi:uncharacterized coiled-coil protein SlyX
MFNWLFRKNKTDVLSDELDRKIAAVEARIAAKEKIAKNLEESIAQKEATVKRLKDRISRGQKAMKRNQN